MKGFYMFTKVLAGFKFKPFISLILTALFFLTAVTAALPGGLPSKKVSLDGVKSFANAYGNYDSKSLAKFMQFDLIVIEPYDVPNVNFLKKLKKKGVIILAYISVGEAGANRRYFKNWRSYANTPDNPAIPRSKVTKKSPMFIGEDPGWPGSYYADASNPGWRNIILNEEIPYILWLGKGLYDGFFLDVLDAADVYKTKKNGPAMIDGLIGLVKEMREKYPDKLLVANRGFTVLTKIAPFIDAFKYEEYTSAYGNVKGEPHYRKYYLKIDKKGHRTNESEIKTLEAALKINPSIRILILDHVKTKPADVKIARFCYEEAQKLAGILKCSVLWYANAVNQDLPIWPDFNSK